MKKKKLWPIVQIGMLVVMALVVIGSAYVINQRNLAAKKSQAFNRPYLRWYHPNYHSDFKHDFNSEAWGKNFSDPAFERDVLSNIDVMGLFILQVGENKNNFLANLIPSLKRKNVKLAIEGMGLPHVEVDKNGKITFIKCDDPNRLEKQIASELGMIKKIYDLGGEVAYLGLDDPLARGLKNSHYDATVFGCNGTAAQSIDWTLKYVAAIQKQYPAIKIGLITNFPNWPYGDAPSYTMPTAFGNYKYMLTSFMEQAKNRGVTISFVNVDNPYDYAIGANSTEKYPNVRKTDWMQRLLDLEAQVKSYGLEFGLIYNTERGGSSTENTTLYHTDTLDYIRQYHQRGGRPQFVIVESWYPQPSAMLPANKPYTFSYTALEAFKLYDALSGAGNQKTVATANQVYLLRNSQGITLLTLNQAEVQSAQKDHGYVMEKTVFSAWSDKQTSSELKPVHRLIKTGFGYLYTASEAEKDAAIKTNGYTYEGIAFFAYTSTQPNIVPVYRLSRDPGNGSVFLYTTSESEKNKALSEGYTLNGTAFWVAQ